MNLAEKVKKQTDKILRQRALNGTEGLVINAISTGTGAPPPVINYPPSDLAAHKVSDDHDGRYYTQTESDARYPIAVREVFNALDVIVVTHNMGRRPLVQVVGQPVVSYGAGNYGDGAYGGIDSTANAVMTPSSIVHDSLNQVTVTLSAAATGEVICVG